MRKILLILLICLSIFGCINLIGCSSNPDTGSQITQPEKPSEGNNENDNTNTNDKNDTDNEETEDDNNTNDEEDKTDEEKPVEIEFDKALQTSIIDEIKLMAYQFVGDLNEDEVFDLTADKASFTLIIDATNYPDLATTDYIDLIDSVLASYLDSNYSVNINSSNMPVISVIVEKISE